MTPYCACRTSLSHTAVPVFAPRAKAICLWFLIPLDSGTENETQAAQTLKPVPLGLPTVVSCLYWLMCPDPACTHCKERYSLLTSGATVGPKKRSYMGRGGHFSKSV